LTETGESENSHSLARSAKAFLGSHWAWRVVRSAPYGWPSEAISRVDVREGAYGQDAGGARLTGVVDFGDAVNGDPA
jgi:hypothetical protein